MPYRYRQQAQYLQTMKALYNDPNSEALRPNGTSALTYPLTPTRKDFSPNNTDPFFSNFNNTTQPLYPVSSPLNGQLIYTPKEDLETWLVDNLFTSEVDGLEGIAFAPPTPSLSLEDDICKSESESEAVMLDGESEPMEGDTPDAPENYTQGVSEHSSPEQILVGNLSSLEMTPPAQNKPYRVRKSTAPKTDAVVPATAATKRRNPDRDRHNLIEKRYRESIQARLVRLAQVLPGNQADTSAKQGTDGLPLTRARSRKHKKLPEQNLKKACILDEAIAYIQEMEQKNIVLQAEAKSLNEMLKNVCQLIQQNEPVPTTKKKLAFGKQKS